MYIIREDQAIPGLVQVWAFMKAKSDEHQFSSQITAWLDFPVPQLFLKGCDTSFSYERLFVYIFYWFITKAGPEFEANLIRAPPPKVSESHRHHDSNVRASKEKYPNSAKTWENL